MIKNIQKLLFNFINSINGFKIVLKEHSFKAEIIVGIVLIPFLIIINTSDIIKILIIIIYFLLLAFELFNTSIEKLSDKINKEFDLDIKNIKDMSSAAVFIILLLLIFLLILSILISN
jgi:diacylglycerol kinase (ATP)|tara:strand:- start:298 stop:651 length:354 start_codon:yes stop_codon:yes gene_type:complete